MSKLSATVFKHTLVTTMSFLVLLVAYSSCLASADPQVPKTSCTNFDKIALKLAFAQDKMQSPVEAEEIFRVLDTPTLDTYSAVASHSWVHKNRALLVTISNSNITNKLLTGDDDGSITSKKMEQIYAKLKTATSVWSIKDIQNQLGPGFVTNGWLHNFTWYCGFGAITIAANENNKIVSATITYTALPNLIESRIGPNHPTWDTKTDSLGQGYRAWQRSFATNGP